jgi:hypothetical protein
VTRRRQKRRVRKAPRPRIACSGALLTRTLVSSSGSRQPAAPSMAHLPWTSSALRCHSRLAGSAPEAEREQEVESQRRAFSRNHRRGATRAQQTRTKVQRIEAVVTGEAAEEATYIAREPRTDMFVVTARDDCSAGPIGARLRGRPSSAEEHRCNRDGSALLVGQLAPAVAASRPDRLGRDPVPPPGWPGWRPPTRVILSQCAAVRTSRPGEQAERFRAARRAGLQRPAQRRTRGRQPSWLTDVSPRAARPKHGERASCCRGAGVVCQALTCHAPTGRVPSGAVSCAET